MRWIKLGRIFCASGQTPLMAKGGRAPVPLHLHGDNFRIFFGALDLEGRSSIFYCDIELKDNFKILDVNTQPILTRGNYGYFDDNGISPSCLIAHENLVYLYTIGFSIKNKNIFDAAIGLAISEDKGRSFNHRLSGPILDRSPYDPCFSTSPSVVLHDGIWHFWYVSGERWEPYKDTMRHFYNIKHRTSDNGIDINKNCTTAIDFANEYEYAIARPSVILDKDKWRMWYCFRGQPGIETFRIGYAESDDAIHWCRKDDLMKDFTVSDEGWDSEMVCYPMVFRHNTALYMLYNGNGYGKTGFGLARLEHE